MVVINQKQKIRYEIALNGIKNINIVRLTQLWNLGMETTRGAYVMGLCSECSAKSETRFLYKSMTELESDKSSSRICDRCGKQY